MEFRERGLDLKNYPIVDGTEYCVSTVALQINHGFDGVDAWYETMIFHASDGEISDYCDLYCRRYATKAEAEQGHLETLNALEHEGIELRDWLDSP